MKSVQKAFTLIELLVVLFIITLTISISLHGINNARIQARTAVCMANLYAVGVHHHMYEIEENTPFYNQSVFIAGYYTLQNKYNIPLDIFDCPGTPAKPTTPQTLLIDYQTYLCDWKLLREQAARPQEFTTLWDKLLIYQALAGGTVTSSDTYSTILTRYLIPGSANHKYRCTNLLFLDGHIENYKPLQ